MAKTAAYRLLCEKICAEIIILLKQGCKARKAAATAVALLEVKKKKNEKKFTTQNLKI